MKVLGVSLLLHLAVHYSVAAPTKAGTATRGLSLQEVRTTPELLRQLNSYRQRAGLSPLVLSETACQAARLQAFYNLAHRTHGHYHPQYATPRQRLAAVGHQFEPANGYLSYGYENCVRFQGMRPANLNGIETEILRAYMRSPKH